MKISKAWRNTKMMVKTGRYNINIHVLKKSLTDKNEMQKLRAFIYIRVYEKLA